MPLSLPKRHTDATNRPAPSSRYSQNSGTKHTKPSGSSCFQRGKSQWKTQMFSPKISLIMSQTTVKFDRITSHDIYEPMLFIDASRISILATARLFIRRRCLERIFPYNVDKSLNNGSKFRMTRFRQMFLKDTRIHLTFTLQFAMGASNISSAVWTG